MPRQPPAQMDSVPGARADIAGVHIDPDAPALTRAAEYLRQIKNPYAFQCGEIAVNLRFCPDGQTLRQALAGCLSTGKESE